MNKQNMKTTKIKTKRERRKRDEARQNTEEETSHIKINSDAIG